VPPAALQTLSQGRHTLWVRAHDSAGNWGVVNSTTVNLAVTGAATTGLTVTPNPTSGQSTLTVSATGDDSALGGTVTGAEYFVDAADTNGTGGPLTLNQPGTQVSAETATVPLTAVAALAEGRHTVLVHTRDSLGLWGPMGYGLGRRGDAQRDRDGRDQRDRRGRVVRGRRPGRGLREADDRDRNRRHDREPHGFRRGSVQWFAHLPGTGQGHGRQLGQPGIRDGDRQRFSVHLRGQLRQR
jgi:hypothetical protein